MALQDDTDGPWNAATFASLRSIDPAFADACDRMATNPWRSGVLPRKTVELVALAVCVACTNLNADGTRRHMRAALAAGASRAEILMIAKMGSLMAIHSLSLGAPILLEEAKAAGVPASAKLAPPPTPACDKIRAMGQWNDAWNPFFDLDPAWTDAFMAAGANVYASGVFEPKLVELLSIAFDASFTHMYAPGTRRHIRAALKLGATVEEVMEVLKICVAEGVQSVNLAVPILAELLAEQEKPGA
ncbi:MAG: carboxymuconolactone decarboxylase family protein [Hyphomicrobiales bacterium]